MQWLLSVTGYITLLTRQVTCQEDYKQCYNDVNICLWTNGQPRSQSAAQTDCQQRNNSFLPRITDGSIQNKLPVFRAKPNQYLGSENIWIDVNAVDADSFHWIDGSSLTGLSLLSTTIMFLPRDAMLKRRTYRVHQIRTFMPNILGFSEPKHLSDRITNGQLAVNSNCGRI